VLDADSGQTSSFYCSTGPLKVLGTGVTISCSTLPSHHSRGRGNDCMHSSTAEMCGREGFRERTQMRSRTHIAVHTGMRLRTRVQHGRVYKRTRTHLWMRLQAYTQRLWHMQMLPCVKLQTVIIPLPMVWVDTDPMQTLRTWLIFLAKAKNVSVRTSLPCSSGHHLRRLPPRSRHAASSTNDL